MKTYVATLSQKPLWDGDLPPVPEGARLIVGPMGSPAWIVDRAYIHLEKPNPPWQTLYVAEADRA